MGGWVVQGIRHVVGAAYKQSQLWGNGSGESPTQILVPDHNGNAQFVGIQIELPTHT